jgi:hypothetical protein
VWLVNLVNFLDGVDWITVAESCRSPARSSCSAFPERSGCCLAWSPLEAEARVSF